MTDEAPKAPEKTSIFTYVQYATTGAAVVMFMRSSNRFLTHRQRGATILGAAGCLYLSVANEFGIFPFNFFVKERMVDVKEKLLQKDCFECRVTGTAGCFAIGSFILYSSMASFYQKRPLGRLAVQGLGAGAFYLSASRWFRLPPFSHLRDDIDE